MKLTLHLSRIAVLSLVAAAGGLALPSLALALFAGTAGVLVLLVAAGDYARRPNYLARVAVASGRSREVMPLAA